MKSEDYSRRQIELAAGQSRSRPTGSATCITARSPASIPARGSRAPTARRRKRPNSARSKRRRATWRRRGDSPRRNRPALKLAHRVVSLLSGNERKGARGRARIRSSFKSIELRRPGHSGRTQRRPVVAPAEGGRATCAISRTLAARLIFARDRQPLDDRRRDVRRDAQPHEVVDDQAVEETAEKILRRWRQRRLQTEDRVRGHDARRQDRRDERQAVRGARDVAIRQTRPLVARPSRRSASARCSIADAAVSDAHAERLDQFALDHRQAAALAGRNAPRSSVAFSSRPKRACPTRCAAERLESATPRVRRWPGPEAFADRGRQIVPRERFEHRGRCAVCGTREDSRRAACRSSRSLSSRIGGIGLAEPAAGSSASPDRFAADSRRKRNAAMDREDRAPVVEADQAIDGALREEQASKRRAAVVGREAGRQDEADAAHRPRQRDRALDEQLVAVGVSVRLCLVDAGVAREPDQRRHRRERAVVSAARRRRASCPTADCR